MTPINCPRCGRLFTKVISPVCPRCEKLEEEQFVELRKFIEEEPLATITEVSDATGVPTKRILRYIREGRIIVPEGMAGLLRCVSCGEPVDEGSFCIPCAKKMAQDLSSLYSDKAPPIEPEPKDSKHHTSPNRGTGMHTRDRIKQTKK